MEFYESTKYVRIWIYREQYKDRMHTNVPYNSSWHCSWLLPKYRTILKFK